MEALTGTPAERAAAALAAGCDLALYCPGDRAGTASVLESVPNLTSQARARLAAARALATRRHLALDPAGLKAERDGMPL
jgi:beta-N-acetylhexosaminidase